MTPSFAVEQVRPPMTARQAQIFSQLRSRYLAHGFAGFTLDDAATEMHCSKSTIYALAATREQLVRTVVVSFFRDAAELVEQRVAQQTDPIRRLETYLESVADALKPASASFMDDVAAFAPAREIYQRNTEIATQRVRELIDEGVASGAFRDVATAFIAEVMASVMVRIQQREISQNTGLTDADAYQGLATLIVHGVIRPAP